MLNVVVTALFFTSLLNTNCHVPRQLPDKPTGNELSKKVMLTLKYSVYLLRHKVSSSEIIIVESIC